METKKNVRDLIINDNKYKKRDSQISNKKLIIEDSEEDEEEKQVIKIKPKSAFRKQLKKERSKLSYKSNKIKDNKIKNELKSEYSYNNINKTGIEGK